MSDMTEAPNTRPADRAIKLDMLADITVRVTVEVGSASLTLASLLELSEGSVLELDRQVNDPLDLFVNGTLVARGEIVETNGRFGIRVLDVAPDGERLGGMEARP
ncbi:flagellar motor switch protein FliN [Sphingorhabdus sp.]|jgi:flagellar motor switch protein FliN/FliY|uniref:flagellar motor switch protein FliN n=1 Tax=Sphingorhabdus sp. TaxID=1902408 RepID=UPI0037CC4FA3